MQRTWTENGDFSALSKERPVATLDHRGFGSSPVGEYPTTLVQAATEAFCVLEQLMETQGSTWSSFVLLGHSFGGLVALQLALLLRGRDDLGCKGLILLSTGLQLRRHGGLTDLVYNNTAPDPKLFTLKLLKTCIVPSGVKEGADGPWTLFLKNTDSLNQSRELKSVEEQMDAQLGGAAEVLEQVRLLERIPSLVLYGRDDGVLDLVSLPSVAEQLGSNRSKTTIAIEGAGHWTWVSHFDETLSACRGFLSSVDNLPNSRL